MGSYDRGDMNLCVESMTIGGVLRFLLPYDLTQEPHEKLNLRVCHPHLHTAEQSRPYPPQVQLHVVYLLSNPDHAMFVACGGQVPHYPIP